MDTRELLTSTDPSRPADAEMARAATARANGRADRRAHPRAAVALDVEYGSLQDFTAAYLRNISGGGVFVVTDEPRLLNDVVTVRFTLPGTAHRFTVECQVVWSQLRSTHAFPAGMGLKFLSLTPAELNTIAHFVAQQLEAAATGRGQSITSTDETANPRPAGVEEQR